MASPNSSKKDRLFPRVSLDAILYFKVDRPPEVLLRIGQETKVGYAVDISEAGISFLVDIEIPKSTEIELSFNLVFADGKKPRIITVGEVVYCFPRVPQKTYRVGILFTEITQKDKNLIEEYIKFSFLHPKIEDEKKVD
jgi:hypothetical protein